MGWRSNAGNKPLQYGWGNAEVIMPYIKHSIIYEEALVLKGLKVIYDLNK